MDTTRILAGGRTLLQANMTTSPSDVCSGASCLLFNMLIIATIALTGAIIIAAIMFQRWKFSRAVRKGSVPAHMLVSYWAVRPTERGDLPAFSFPVHYPVKREDVNEKSCPICLKTRPKATSWIVFEGCNHATCKSCFKKLVDKQRLHAACPMCRSLLAEGKGDRGGPRPKPTVEETAAEEQPPSQQTGDDQV